MNYSLRITPVYEITKDLSDADLVVCSEVIGRGELPCLVIAKGDAEIQAEGRVYISDYMYSCFKYNQNLATDLFAGSGDVLTQPDGQYYPLVRSSAGELLGYFSGEVIRLSDALFSDDATFWKQPQFFPLINDMVSLLLKESHSLPAGNYIVSPSVNSVSAVLPENCIGQLPNNTFSLAACIEPYIFIMMTVALMIVIDIFLFLKGFLV